MNRNVKIKGGEYAISFVRFRDKDFLHSNRNTVTIETEQSYAEVVELFTDPGEWFVVSQYENEPDIVTDCTDFDKLISIRDTRKGVLEVVLSKMTDSEALAELREALANETE